MKVALNVVEILKLLIRSDGEISVSEAAQHLGLNRSSASRLLASLRNGGLLQQDSKNAKYRLGVLAIQLGAFAQRTFSHLEWVQSQLGEVAEATRHTACIGLLDEDTLVIAHSHRLRENTINLSFDLGARLPAWRSALGKVLLAGKPDAELRATLRHASSTGMNEVNGFLKEIETIRRDQIAVSRDEIATGVTSFAVRVAGEPGLDLAVGVAMISAQAREAEDLVRDTLLRFKTRMEAMPLR